MRRTTVTSGMLLSLAIGLMAADAAPAATRCVGRRATCAPTIKAAVDASRDGDTITLDPGVHAGGVVIDRSLRIVGAGASRTTIRGGGPVLTVGTFGAASAPTVEISGVTITGGVTRSSSFSSFLFDGDAAVVALGGGVEVPPAQDPETKQLTTGATLTIRDSVIAHNRVAPSEARPIGPPCPVGRCPFAAAEGGGIDNWGSTTLEHTVVQGNAVGAASALSTLASDAYGGAIMSQRSSSLTLVSAIVRDNRVSAIAPNGRFADSGAILAEGALDIRDSSITGNVAALDAALPADVDLLAIAGAVHATDSSSATVRGTAIMGNLVRATNTVGDATAFSGGFHADVDVALSDDTISGNQVVVTALPSSNGNAHGDSGAGELSGTIARTRLTGNGVTVGAAGRSAEAIAGSVIFGGSMRDSMVAGNRIHARSASGRATAMGAGLQTGGVLDLGHTLIAHNVATATGVTGVAEGGGISNTLLPDGPPLGLTVTDSVVTGNAVLGAGGISASGGGIFSTDPVGLIRSRVTGNVPDQCSGC